MSAAIEHPPAHRGQAKGRRGWALAVVVWIAPVAWFVHLSAGMVLGPESCRWGTELPLHLLTAGALAVAAGGAWLSWRYRTADAASRFVAMMGLVLAAISILAILVVGVITVPLSGCDR